ncbi:hypothetical protein AK830_g6691 [Neonectria ditissima]|uniref:Protein-S-isoprenylcysteine O-methyltransferase n=1 Tax=Neonectria ditissima TaxID=78410 RepID=A0A0P7BBU0_9HYPO|nr:hypothetical protein AK830_g6691 [Neonectria ditissima]
MAGPLLCSVAATHIAHSPSVSKRQNVSTYPPFFFITTTTTTTNSTLPLQSLAEVDSNQTSTTSPPNPTSRNRGKPDMTLSQASLAATMLASTVGTYLALSPPNPSPDSGSPTAVSDSISRFKLTSKHTTKVVLAPLGLLAAHTSGLTYTSPAIPSSLLRHGAANGLNRDLVTWSTATAVPLALILCAGVPLRLVSYASLGKNFTFALAAPDRLNKTGIYGYVQHPSYTGLVVLVLSNIALIFRTDGALSCWIPPSWYQVASQYT